MVLELSGDYFVVFDQSVDVICSDGYFLSGVDLIQWIVSDINEFRVIFIVIGRVVEE